MTPSRKAVDLFLSLGMGASLTWSGLGGPPAALAQHQHQPAAVVDEGGEGGEGGESGSTATNALESDIDVLVVLAQMQGHLLIAQELLALGKSQAAEPHLSHPADELAEALEPALRQRGIAGFSNSLQELKEQARMNPGSAAVNTTLKRVQQTITATRLAMPAAVRNDPQTTLTVVRQLAASAASEYSGAENDGRIVEQLEYQDARGFLLQAQQLLRDAAADSELQNKRAVLAQLKTITTMLTGLPSAMPPAKTLISPQELQALASRL